MHQSRVENLLDTDPERAPLLHSQLKNGTYSSNAPGPTPDRESTVACKEPSFTRLAMIMSTAWFGVFLGAADTTVIATLTGPISSEFGSLGMLSWLATAYLIANAISQPISGRLTDIFGRGPGLAFSNVTFAVGNLICGIATDPLIMILGRAIAGFGGGGLMSIPTFLGSDLIPLRKRGLVGGIANLWYGTGAMMGAFCGGYLNDTVSLGWRFAFLVQVPPSLFSAAVVMVLIRVPPKQSDKSYLKRIDFCGVCLIASFLALLVLGINMERLWTDPLRITAISSSAALFLSFIYWESKAIQPIIPVKLLLNRTVLVSCLANVFCGGIVPMGLFYVPLYLQVRGDSATTAGLKIMPASLGTSLGAVGAGYLMKRTGKYVGLVISSIIALIIGVSLFVLQDAYSPIWVTCLGFFLVGIGYNAVFTITQISCIAAVDHAQQAVVTSATYLSRSLGGTVGITLASVLFQSKLYTGLCERLGRLPNAPEKIQQLLSDFDKLRSLPKGWHDGALEAFMEAFQHVWLTMLIWAVLALICISPIKQHKLFSTLDRK